MWFIFREYRAVLDWNYSWWFTDILSCAWSVFGSVILNLWCVCMVQMAGSRLYHTHTPQVQNYAAKHRPSTRQNICESPWVISVKHSSVLPEDESRKIQNVSEWFLILYLLSFYTTYILTSKFYIFECISQTIKVTDLIKLQLSFH